MKNRVNFYLFDFFEHSLLNHSFNKPYFVPSTCNPVCFCFVITKIMFGRSVSPLSIFGIQ